MPIKTPHEISAAYYQFVDEFTQSDFEDEKLLGKFYTDYDIAGSMMRLLSKHYVYDTLSSELRIIDPFCGDGRLIISLLSELRVSGKLSSNRLFISIWDIDANAVNTAKSDITQFCKSAGLKYELDARQADAFVEYYSVRGKYDICVTNPPWSLLKPQKLFSKSNGEEAMVGYRNVIEEYDSYMKEAFVISQPSSKFGKWGTNLARCGTEVAFRLIKSSGFCGIVSPASLLNDQISSRLRSWIFENYKVINVSYYPAELKLYGRADISSITIVVKGGETDQSLSVRIYSDKDIYKEKKIEKAVYEYIKRTGFCIPLGMKKIRDLLFQPVSERFRRHRKAQIRRRFVGQLHQAILDPLIRVLKAEIQYVALQRLHPPERLAFCDCQRQIEHQPAFANLARASEDVYSLRHKTFDEKPAFRQRLVHQRIGVDGVKSLHTVTHI